MQEQVELVVRAEPENLQLLRLAGAFVAVRAGFGYDEAEDLRLAVDELCTSLLDLLGGADCDFRVRFGWDAQEIDVRVELGRTDGAPTHLTQGQLDELRRARDGDTDGLAPGRISELILEALVDEHGLGLVGGGVTGWFRKRHAVDTN